MIIIPAIDLLDGSCVRLKKGEYDTAEKVAENALETALKFKSSGAELLHIVDLNGAKSGNKVNGELILSIAKHAGIPIEVGGGIRNMESVDFYLDGGASRVILGSSALRDPDFVHAACEKYPTRIAVGIDAKNGMVSVDGWINTSAVNAMDFAKMIAASGAVNIIYTEIERDGMLCGINAETYKSLAQHTKIDITASGGIRNIDDIATLIEAGVYGAICGKSLYSGTLDLEAAIKLTKAGRY